jgi:hypothetical protein
MSLCCALIFTISLILVPVAVPVPVVFGDAVAVLQLTVQWLFKMYTKGRRGRTRRQDRACGVCYRIMAMPMVLLPVVMTVAVAVAVTYTRQR